LKLGSSLSFPRPNIEEQVNVGEEEDMYSDSFEEDDADESISTSVVSFMRQASTE
jgi:hypothetical protein